MWGRGTPLPLPLFRGSARKLLASRHSKMLPGDSTGLLPSMPNGLTYMLLRPLIIPLALVCLALGFVLWRFMGDIPSVLSMGLEVLVDGLAHGGRRPARSPALPIAYPVDAGIDAVRAVDASFSAASRIHEWIEDWTLIRPRVSSPAAGCLVDAMNHVAVHLERAA